MRNNNKDNRTALLIRCTSEEAEEIRESAHLERRTVSGYVLRAVMSRIASRDKIRQLSASRVKAETDSAGSWAPALESLL
jgi:uncharacterized protein (DUF1778 family)